MVIENGASLAGIFGNSLRQGRGCVGRMLNGYGEMAHVDVGNQAVAYHIDRCSASLFRAA